jgi:hypothetical protein
MRHAALMILVMFVVGLSVAAHASTPYSATATINATELSRTVRSPARKGQSFRPIQIAVGPVVGQGRMKIVLNRRKLPSAEACFVLASGECKRDPKVPALFRGYVIFHRLHGADRRLPAAASVIDNQMTVQFVGVRHGRIGNRQRAYTLRWRLGEGNRVTIRVSNKPSSSLLGKRCAAELDPHGMREADVKQAAVGVRAVDTFRVVTLSTDADPEWYAKYGANSNAEIASIINAAEAIYERQMGIRFSIVKQHVYTVGSPYLGTNPSKLLASFARNPDNANNLGISAMTFNQDVDLKHLFTGKDLDGTTIGLSYVGAVCWASYSAYGLTQNIHRDLNIRTFAHEVGHSLGASHDTSDPAGIMFPSLRLQSYFSQFSVNQINDQLAVVGKCVSEQRLSPNLANATITLVRRVSRDRKTLTLKGVLRSVSSAPLMGEAIQLAINSKVISLTTDGKGRFSHSLRMRRLRSKKLVVVAQAGRDGRMASKTLTVLVRT